MINTTSTRRLYLEIMAVLFLAELAVMFVLPFLKPLGVVEYLADFCDASLLSLIAGPLVLWRARIAADHSFDESDIPKVARPQHSVAVKRLYVEIIATIFLVELAVMFFLPIFEGIENTLINFFDATILTLMVGPIITWRCNAAANRSLALENLNDGAQQTASRQGLILAGSVFLMGFGITCVVVHVVRKDIQEEASGDFKHSSELLLLEAERNLNRPLHQLEGIRGLYAAAESIERLEFRAFNGSRNLPVLFPGICGFGTIQHVMRPDLERFVKVEKNDDAPDFDVKIQPDQNNSAPDLYVLKFIEPLEPNRVVWGRDLGAIPALRTEIERAIDTGKPTLAAHLPILQKNQAKTGLSWFLAIYRNGTNPKTPEERRATLVGVIYAPLETHDLLAKLYSTRDVTQGLICFELFSGSECKKADLLLDSDDDEPFLASDIDQGLKEHHAFEEMHSFQTGGRSWSLGTHSTPRFEAGLHQFLPAVCAAGGILLTTLLTSLMMLMSGERTRAFRLARRMTRNFEATFQEKKLLIQTLDLHSIVSYSDLAGNITFANDSFCKISGYSREELIGCNHRIVNSGIQSKEFWSDIWKQISSGQVWQGEVCNQAKDGSQYWVRGTITPFVNTEGKVESYVSIRTDITPNKMTEVQLKTLVRGLKTQTQLAQQFAAKAGEANAAKGEFLANVSHEIRTPMNGVLGMTELLLHSNLNENQHQLAETIKRSGEILLTLINDILDFSKIEAGKLTLEDVHFDLSMLIDECAEVFSIRAQEKGLELVCTIDPEVPLFLCGDQGRLRQILTNLIGNALKFTLEGVIVVRVTRLNPSKDAAVAAVEGETVGLRFSVKDSGIGIPTAKLDKLFQSFSQVDGSFTRKRDGTGLGLVISKQLAQLMHGEIGVNSTEGKGSEFWFTAYLKQQEQQDRPLVPAVIADFVGKSVLLIEHLAEAREVLRVQLAARGMVITEVASATEALHTLNQIRNENKPFDLAMLDTTLMGCELLARTFRNDEHLNQVPLILMMPISNQAKGDTQRFDGVDFAAVLTKPVRSDDLLKCVVMALASAEKGHLGAPYRARKSTMKLSAKKTAAQHAERILVAEDNKINQQVALGMLKTLGYSADIANNGKEALSALASTDYALVFMDMMMPEMDGLAAVEEIRKESSAVRNHQIPVIALTANISSDDRKRCVAVGMDDYISKPISLPVLEKILKKWLSTDPSAASSATLAAVAVPASQTAAALKEKDAPPIFDREGMLTRLDNDQELARTLSLMFIKDIHGQIQQLTDFLAKKDTKQCEILVHAIKGAAMTMGGEAMRAIAYELELTAKAGDLIGFALRLPELSVQFEALKKELSTFAESAES